ncbi:hypothetical protein A8H39_12420 [Paraburkholderia fungorum]|nr:hypothetical protein A8H39_12420 [Paraburkholderia fungorum]
MDVRYVPVGPSNKMHLSPRHSGLFSFFSYSIHGRQETLTFGRYGVGESLPAAIRYLTRFRFVHERGWTSRYVPAPFTLRPRSRFRYRSGRATPVR